MFIILLAFSAGSIVTLSHKPLVFNMMNHLVLLPLAIYSITQYIYSNDSSKLWILGYTTINIIYNYSQGKVVKEEINSRFGNEYDLKKSLKEVALSKKNLEEESIKTFHASRLSSLGEMAGSVAHEINNPLTIIQGLTKSIIVHDEENISESTVSKLAKINSASERIAKIVKGMKIISSKNDQIEHEVVKVSKVLEISIDLYEEKLKNEGIHFNLENINDPEIVCNPLQISQILINLMSNAIDALQRFEGERYLTVKVTEDYLNHNVDIRVINSGPLLEEAVAAKIFEPFFSTKSLGKGTGLGLSISQTLAHSNHGLLIYESYENQVCFRLHLNTRT
jgi:C4-dicarboxylate-specific signal transduction histidine kinase